MVNVEQIKGNWDQIKGVLQQKWGKLTHDDISEIEGNRKRLVGALEKKYGLMKEEAEKEVAEWEDALE